MTALLERQELLWAFLYFCRIGGMVMVFPGYSSARIPVRVRLLLAVGITAALAPLLTALPGAAPPQGEVTPEALLALIAGEGAKGLTLGLVGRMFFLAFEFLATAMTQFIGMGNFPGMPAEGQEPVPALVSFVMLAATVMIFLSGLHLMVLEAVVDSYAAFPVGTFMTAGAMARNLVDNLAAATMLSLQAVAPFVVYAVIVNLAIGLVNRMTPQIPVYFISLPLVLGGGMFLLFFMMDDMFGVFLGGFADWLGGG